MLFFEYAGFEPSVIMTVPNQRGNHVTVQELRCSNTGETFDPAGKVIFPLASPRSNQQERDVSSFFCDLLALDHEQRKRHSVLAKDLLAKHLELRELPDGYGLRFPNDRLLFTAISEWATLEQLCCPFLTLTLELHHDLGPMWLKVTGTDGVKDFLRAELGI